MVAVDCYFDWFVFVDEVYGFDGQCEVCTSPFSQLRKIMSRRKVCLGDLKLVVETGVV